MANYTQYENNGQKLWKVRGYLGTDELTGKQKQIQRQGFKTKKEARQAYEEAKRDFENGLEVAKPENLTYRQVYHEWLENFYTDSVKESTLHKTMVDFRIRILPVFGDIRISKITSAMLQDALNTWHKEYKNFKYYYNQTVRILDYALIQGYIHENPKHRVSTKKRKISYDSEHSGTLFYTKDQLKQFLDFLKHNRDARWHCFFRLLAFTGMRKGEALALTWQDISFKHSTVTIDKTLTHGMNYKLIVNSPKSESGIRTITVDATTLQVLKDWKTEQAKLMLRYGFNTLKPEQLIFSKYSTNTHLHLSAPYNRMRTITNLAGLPMIPVHGFRHTHCSLLFNAGVSMKDVMNRLGHSDIQTTMNIYAHVTEDQEKKSAKLFAEHVGF